MNRLPSSWQLWAHLPHDTDWSMTSYTPVMKLSHAEEIVALTHALPEKLVTNCMLFFMREDVLPTWEDPKNREGGCFSYKVPNKAVAETWKELWMLLAGESIGDMASDVTGLSVSPKKGFCVMKIWMTNSKHQNPLKIMSKTLKPQGCIFKRHSD
jgi:hypothetical protein